MAKKKEFKAGAYGVIAGIIIAAILVGLTVFAFTSRYNAFSPEKVAQSYADTIVQDGDGYNALKVSLVSKNQKFGSFVINAYMAPYVNDGDDVKKNEEIGKGTQAEADMLDTIYSTMYDFYVKEINEVGLQNYDVFYSQYFSKLKEVRQEILKDDYMDTEFMFSVFESNVASYGESLTGTEEKLAADEKTVLKEASTGKYQELFGNDYKLTTTVKETVALTADEAATYKEIYKSNIASLIKAGEEKASTLADEEKQKDMKEAFTKLDCSDDISDVNMCTVEITDQNGKVVASTKVYVVKIGNSWYVDNTTTDTAPLYLGVTK